MRLIAQQKRAEPQDEPYLGQRWEYKAVQMRKLVGDFEKLNSYGEQGWELVGFDVSMVAWFKRPTGNTRA